MSFENLLEVFHFLLNWGAPIFVGETRAFIICKAHLISQQGSWPRIFQEKFLPIFLQKVRATFLLQKGQDARNMRPPEPLLPAFTQGLRPHNASFRHTLTKVTVVEGRRPSPTAEWKTGKAMLWSNGGRQFSDIFDYLQGECAVF